MQPKTLVTAGKGGTGKSLILSQLLQRHILGQKFGRVLMVDADPHQSLTRFLNVQPRITLGDLRQKYERKLKTGQDLQETSRSALARKLAQRAMVKLKGADLLVMGHNSGPGCQCLVNTILAGSLDALMAEYDLVLVDNEAGIEPIGRQNWPINFLLLVSAPKYLEMEVALQILERAKEVGRTVERTCLLINSLHPGQDLAIPLQLSSSLLGILPYSPGLAQEDRVDPDWDAALEHVWRKLQGLMF